VNVPKVVLEQVRVEEPPAGKATPLGFSKPPVSPVGGEIEATDNATEPCEALPAFTVIVDVPEAPARTVTVSGFDVRKKSEAARTATVTVVARGAPAAEALT
jgi:hypothetical protein